MSEQTQQPDISSFFQKQQKKNTSKKQQDSKLQGKQTEDAKKKVSHLQLYIYIIYH
jgi:hypothetical protein